MDIKSEYEKLYQHWLNEFEQTELTPLNKELYSHYKTALDYLNNYKLDQTDSIKLDVINSYKENFNYLFKDFAKIREIKIINAALALKEINLNILLESEKLFYQNLVSAVKGFKKVKTIDGEKIEELNIIEEKGGLESIENANLEQTKSSIQINESLDTGLVIKAENEDFNYTLVRFLKKTPPLVGIDLLNYGPFEKEDIANLPYKNAIILLNENIVEKIELI